MTCEQCRDAISARLDGEDPGVGESMLNCHLDQCQACRLWQRDVAALARRLRVRPAERIPDLSGRVAAAASAAPQQRRYTRGRAGARLGLVLVAAAQLSLALPEIIGGHHHAGNEVASWSVAAAVGLLSAAQAPRRASGLLPVIAAAAVVLTAVAVCDIVSGHVHLEQELSHLLLVVGVGLLWSLLRAEGQPPQRDDALAPVPSPGPTGRAPRTAGGRAA